MGTRTIRDIVATSARRIGSHQRGDGAFSFCCEVTPMPDAMMVVLLCCLQGYSDAFVQSLCRDILHHQNDDGSWTAYPDQDENVSLTVLALFALRLAKFPAINRMNKAKQYILHHGGMEQASHLTKIVLAIAGEVSWASIPDGHIEFMLLDKGFPLNIYDLSSYARLHFVPFMVLSHLRFSYQMPTPILGDLSVHQETNWLPPIDFHIPIQNHAALNRCREFILSHLEPNGTLASYTSATLFAIAALQALGYPKHHPTIQRAIQGLKEMAYPRSDRLHQQIFTSTVWDTALSLQALQAASAALSTDVSQPGVASIRGWQFHTVGESRPFIYHDPMRRGMSYLLSKQQNLVGDWGIHAPRLRPGGWGFSDVNTLYPDLDDTVATLKALYPYRKHFPSEWKRGVRWILGMQNDDGGFAAFERNNNKGWLEHIPINDMGRAMTDPSSPDLTGRVTEALSYIGVSRRHPEVMRNASKWLLQNQQQNGSWYGRWGICYIYGTWAAVIGLRSAGIRLNHPSLTKAYKWFEGIQNQDGGFGESCKSDELGHYVPLKSSTSSTSSEWNTSNTLSESSTSSQTAWALMGMMASSPSRTHAIDRAARYLKNSARPQGGWVETYPTGTGVAGQAYIRYHSYPYVWPTIALSQYLLRFGES